MLARGYHGDHDGHGEDDDGGETHVVEGGLGEVILMKCGVDGRRADFRGGVRRWRREADKRMVGDLKVYIGPVAAGNGPIIEVKSGKGSSLPGFDSMP